MTFETSDSIKVSIIIPTKNNGNIIERGLRSIINPFRKSVDGKRFADLDYPKDKLEIIIVDGRSTDKTGEIAKRYGYKVVYEDIGTIGGERNIGVENKCYTF